MRRRCYVPSRNVYHRYGGNGVSVCPRWLESFDNFIADMGYPPTLAHTIERRDSTGNYEPDNCCWATQTEQNRNRSTSVYITHEGETLTLIQWAQRFDLEYHTVYRRYKLGKRGPKLFSPSKHRKK
jgi:hypothetical protein